MPETLLDFTADDPRVADALRPLALESAATAHARLLKVADDDVGKQLLGRSIPALLVALSETARPDAALVNLERLMQAVPSRHATLALLADQPRAIEILVRLFVGSQFLTEIVLRNPAYVERLTQHHRLADLKSVQQFYVEAQGSLMGLRDVDEQLNALRRFQRWELLRIGVCDFFGLLDLKRVTVQLSLLADSLVQACLGVAAEETGTSTDGLAVLAMGKLGGEELNYSSDIDLVLVAEANGMGYWRLAQRMIRALTLATGDGFLYRVDMRLRPWGNSGELVSTRETHLGYLRRTAQHWEKQAMLKARAIAGDLALGTQFLRHAEPLLFTVPQDQARESVRGMKQKIEAELQRKGRLFGEVKLGEGSIRDVEFVVQYLQLVHGGSNPAVRSFNTLDALVRLTDMGHMHADEYRLLSDGYVFLRTIEHSLQLMHNKQTHELPADPGELTSLARRLDFGGGADFLAHYRRHCTAIRTVYERYLGSQNKAQPARGPAPASRPGVQKHVARLEQAYTQTFTPAEIERHATLAERVSDLQPILVESSENADGSRRLTIVGLDFPGELSHICGLMLVHGFDILQGEVFTYEPLSAAEERRSTEQRPGTRRSASRRQPRPVGADQADVRRKIVDVFTIRRESGPIAAELIQRYADDLSALVRLLAAGQATEAHGALVKRVAAALRERPPTDTGILYPIEVRIDNDESPAYTILHIETRDTIGFLFELTNALALHGVYIARVQVESAGSMVRDTLHVTDAQGRKISDPHRQRELQAALVLIKHFTHLLPKSPNPEAALLHFREFLAQLFSRPDWTEDLATLERSDVMDALARLLGVSDFLWNDFLRMQHANLFPVVRDVEQLATGRTRAELQRELSAALATAATPQARREELNSFKDREMFRVDMRHILGHAASFPEFSAELSDVAELVVSAAYTLVDSELKAQFGTPRPAGDPQGIIPLAVCALGKFGGRELGFASDIELMFVYAGDGATNGPASLGAAEFFIKLVEGTTHAIHARREGIFQIDLRLRPYGRAGSLAVPLQAFEQYFRPEGPAWPFERQALVKLRPVAGDLRLGETILALRDEFLYTGKPFDVVAMRAMRERQLRQLVTPGTFNAKLSPGGLVDVEYLVQGLQITHGQARPEIRQPNTLDALRALARTDLVSADDRQRLEAAYLFLRRLIDGLRIVRGNAKDLTTPPPGGEEFAFLARRLGYDDRTGDLERDLSQHSDYVRDASARLLG